METFGFFETESSHHASEYLPYFRKDPETVSYIPERWDYYEIGLATTSRAISTRSSSGWSPTSRRRSSTAPSSSTRW